MNSLQIAWLYFPLLFLCDEKFKIVFVVLFCSSARTTIWRQKLITTHFRVGSNEFGGHISGNFEDIPYDIHACMHACMTAWLHAWLKRIGMTTTKWPTYVHSCQIKVFKAYIQFFFIISYRFCIWNDASEQIKTGYRFFVIFLFSTRFFIRFFISKLTRREIVRKENIIQLLYETHPTKQ